jgi:hypothetical protein
MVDFAPFEHWSLVNAKKKFGQRPYSGVRADPFNDQNPNGAVRRVRAANRFMVWRGRRGTSEIVNAKHKGDLNTQIVRLCLQYLSQMEFDMLSVRLRIVQPSTPRFPCLAGKYCQFRGG